MKRCTLAILLLAGCLHSAWADVNPPGGKAEAAWTFSHLLEDTDLLDGVVPSVTSSHHVLSGYAVGAGWFSGELSDVFVDQHIVVHVGVDDSLYGMKDFYILHDDLLFELTPNTRLTVSGQLRVSATAPTDDLITAHPELCCTPVRLLTWTYASAAILYADDSVISSLVASPDNRELNQSFQFVVETGPGLSGFFYLKAEMELGGTLEFREVTTQPVPEPASLALLALGLPLVLGLPAWRRQQHRALRTVSWRLP